MLNHPDPMAIATSGRVLSSVQRCHLLNLVGFPQMGGFGNPALILLTQVWRGTSLTNFKDFPHMSKRVNC
jgi:hypothetical protein